MNWENFKNIFQLKKSNIFNIFNFLCLKYWEISRATDGHLENDFMMTRVMMIVDLILAIITDNIY